MSNDMIGMKCLIPLFVLFIFSISIALAEKDSVTTGPYNISFDLGVLRDSYTVTVNPQKEGSGVKTYGVSIVNQTADALRKAGIGLSYYTVAPPSNDWGETMKQVAHGLGLSNEAIETRAIDGTTGGFVSGNLDTKDNGSIKVYTAYYYSPIDTHLLVQVTSSYPWEGETSSLLNTIHVEKVK